MANELKIFISWSGPFAKAVAGVLRPWIRNLTDRIEPWMSDADIGPGSRSMDAINTRLNDTNFGIIVVTRDNQHAPWLNFEAGALSRQVAGAESRVVPLLVDMTSPTDLTGPLSQYHAQLFGESGVAKLAQAIAALVDLDKNTLDARFTKFWPDLEDEVNEIIRRNADGELAEPMRSERELLGETLTRVRDIERIITSTAGSPNGVLLRKPPGMSEAKIERYKLRHLLDRYEIGEWKFFSSAVDSEYLVVLKRSIPIPTEIVEEIINEASKEGLKVHVAYAT
jgi:hypothetical protein